MGDVERTTINKSLEQLVCGEEGGLQTAYGGQPASDQLKLLSFCLSPLCLLWIGIVLGLLFLSMEGLEHVQKSVGRAIRERERIKHWKY